MYISIIIFSNFDSLYFIIYIYFYFFLMYFFVKTFGIVKVVNSFTKSKALIVSFELLTRICK